MNNSFNSKFKRSNKKRKLKKVYKIFCEWESEENYFKSLWKKLWKNVNCTKLQHKDIKWIIDEIRTAKDRSWLEKSDRVFCVIDKDYHSIQEFQSNSTSLEKQSELILSSKSFEVWVLMHFSKFETEVQDILEYKWLINSNNNKQLFQRLWFNWEVRKPYTNEKFFEILYNHTEDAINNAKSVSEKQLKENAWNKYKCEPYTDIWKLVEELKKP